MTFTVFQVGFLDFSYISKQKLDQRDFIETAEARKLILHFRGYGDNELGNQNGQIKISKFRKKDFKIGKLSEICLSNQSIKK